MSEYTKNISLIFFCHKQCDSPNSIECGAQPWQYMIKVLHYNVSSVVKTRNLMFVVLVMCLL